MGSRRNRKYHPEEGTSNRGSLEWLADRMQLPAEVLVGAPLLVMDGRYQIWVENYKSILEYSDCRIRLLTRQGRIQICGSRLCIDEYTCDGMRIIGCIKSVDYEE